MRRIERSAFGLAIVATLGVLSCSAPTSGRNAASFGKLGDTPVQLYTLTNKHGLVAKITNYGAIVTEPHVLDRTGVLSDIALGFENLDGYIEGSPYFGAIVGRVANRIKNAEFTLEGKRYRSTRTTSRITCMAAGRGGTKWYGQPWPSMPPEVRRSN